MFKSRRVGRVAKCFHRAVFESLEERRLFSVADESATLSVERFRQLAEHAPVTASLKNPSPAIDAAESLPPMTWNVQMVEEKVYIGAFHNPVPESPDEEVSFSIWRKGLTTDTITVTYTIGGSATGGEDYNNSGFTGSVTLGPGGIATIAGQIYQDNLVEGEENVVGTLQPGSGYVVGSGSATFAIADDPPIVTITTTDGVATELESSDTPDNGIFTVTRTGGDTSTPILVSIGYTGTASRGSDYNAVTSVSVGTSNTITVEMIDDTAEEDDETIIATTLGEALYIRSGLTLPPQWQ
jgi:hypothetical protein